MNASRDSHFGARVARAGPGPIEADMASSSSRNGLKFQRRAFMTEASANGSRGYSSGNRRLAPVPVRHLLVSVREREHACLTEPRPDDL